MNWQLACFEQLESTQSYLCAQALSLPEGQCIIAHQQTAGQGRQARSWDSAPGGLYCSFLLKPSVLLPDLPFALWWAILKTLEEQSHLKLRLKAPNDILYGSGKLAGMLIDAKIQQNRPLYYVCGVGINLNQQTFASELAESAVSLRQATGQCWEPEEILNHFLEQFALIYQLLLAGDFEARILAALSGRPVQMGYNSPDSILFEEYWYGKSNAT